MTNGASYAGNLAPGSLAVLFGSDLVPAGATPSDVSVSVNGQQAPLTYVSPGQINFQVPYETSPGQASITVGASAAFSFTVAPAAPGIFAPDGTHALAANQDGSVNGQANPAPAGSTVIVYLTGIGPLDNPVATGAQAPPQPLSRATLPSSATIGGQTAPMSFLGLTPGFIGLAQANLIVPSLSTSEYPVLITVGGVASAPAMLSVGSTSPGPVSKIVVDSNTPRPDGQGMFTPFAVTLPALEGNLAVFHNADDSIWTVNVDTGVFRKLADTQTTVPGGSGTFSSFFYNFNAASGVSPQIRNGTVVFFGRDATGGVGLYSVSAAGGAITRVANYNTSDPQGGTFNYLNALDQFFFDGSHVVFDSAGSDYTVNADGSSLALLAGRQTVLCSDSAFAFGGSFLSPSVSGNQATILMGNGFDFSRGTGAIFTGPVTGFPSDAQPCPMPYVPHPNNVISTEALPGNTNANAHTRIDSAILESGTIYFSADDSLGSYSGIFSASATVATPAGGPITRLFDSASSGLTASFDNFVFSVDRGSVAFDAYDSVNHQNYYLVSGGVLSQLTNNPTNFPFNSLHHLNPHSLSNGRLVFMAGNASYAAVYLASQ